MGEVFDVVIVGGGTAGCVLARRLADDPARRVCLIEAGPSDEHEPRALELIRWSEMLEGEYDYDYRSVPQPHGNSAVRQARARILGGCSAHNNMIAWRPPVADLEEWVGLGATGWGPSEFLPLFDRLLTPIEPVAPEHRNPYLVAFLEAASSTLGVPLLDCFDASAPREGAGFFSLGYTSATGRRSSASAAYLHEVLDARPNLELKLETRALRLLFDDQRRASGVELRDRDGSVSVVHAEREVVLCGGAIDSPRLLLHSGIGPAAQLRELGIDVVADVPGVGENLVDHAEGLVVWELAKPLPPIAASQWDAGILLSLGGGRDAPDLLCHIPLLTFAMHPEALGFATPELSATFTPNVAKPRSRGRVFLSSADPDSAPGYDPRYLSDPEGYDLATLVEGVHVARRIAAAPELAEWIVRESFPGPEVTDPDELAALVRATHHTVYHPCGTCRMGRDDDPLAVCDAELRVRGVRGLRVADASVFPTITAVNPVVTVLMVGERAAELIAAS